MTTTGLPKNWNRTICPVQGHREVAPDPIMPTDCNPVTRPYTCECGRSFRSLAAGARANGWGVFVKIPRHYVPEQQSEPEEAPCD